jgi:hypothetical protein
MDLIIPADNVVFVPRYYMYIVAKWLKALCHAAFSMSAAASCVSGVRSMEIRCRCISLFFAELENDFILIRVITLSIPRGWDPLVQRFALFRLGYRSRLRRGIS